MTRITKFHLVLRASLALSGAAFIGGCAQYAVITEKQPRFENGATAPTLCQECIAAGMREEKHKPLVALGEYLSAADVAAQRLQKNPKDQAALNAYNFAVARSINTIEKGNLDPWTRPLEVPGRNGTYILTNKPDRRPSWAPQYYRFTPADQFDVGGSYVTERTVKAGLGAPLAAVGKEQRADARERFISHKTYYGITAVARFEPGRRCVMAFEDPLEKETTTLDGHTYTLAADFTVSMAVMLKQENPKKMEIARVLKPEKYAETAHVVRLEPYNPNKVVIVVVHGLMDSPATWTAMINHLRGDPVIRQKYQFWYYSYPSGYPYPYSAAIMRSELDAIEKVYPANKGMILIGHSMGCLVSRLMITDSGEKIWRDLFGKSPSEMKLSEKTRKLLTDSLIFHARPEVKRAIFIAGPHRGSDLASNWLGRFGSSLVRAPRTLLNVARDMRHYVLADASALQVKHIPNSVDTLAPNNRFVRSINKIPISSKVPYHSIIGDRGRGDSPNSSDGFVPYWSSHLEGAASELIVPSNHSAQRNPEAIAEVKRILYLHLGKKVAK